MHVQLYEKPLHRTQPTVARSDTPAGTRNMSHVVLRHLTHVYGGIQYHTHIVVVQLLLYAHTEVLQHMKRGFEVEAGHLALEKNSRQEAVRAAEEVD